MKESLLQEMKVDNEKDGKLNSSQGCDSYNTLRLLRQNFTRKSVNTDGKFVEDAFIEYKLSTKLPHELNHSCHNKIDEVKESKHNKDRKNVRGIRECQPFVFTDPPFILMGKFRPFPTFVDEYKVENTAETSAEEIKGKIEKDLQEKRLVTLKTVSPIFKDRLLFSEEEQIRAPKSAGMVYGPGLPEKTKRNARGVININKLRAINLSECLQNFEASDKSFKILLQQPNMDQSQEDEYFHNSCVIPEEQKESILEIRETPSIEKNGYTMLSDWTGEKTPNCESLRRVVVDGVFPFTLPAFIDAVCSDGTFPSRIFEIDDRSYLLIMCTIYDSKRIIEKYSNSILGGVKLQLGYFSIS